MVLTREFKETIKSRADNDPAFRAALLVEAVSLLLDGDVATGKALLRDCTNATIGFDALGEAVGKSPKSLMRMFSAKGNPRADSLFLVISHLQKSNDVHLELGT